MYVAGDHAVQRSLLGHPSNPTECYCRASIGLGQSISKTLTKRPCRRNADQTSHALVNLPCIERIRGCRRRSGWPRRAAPACQRTTVGGEEPARRRIVDYLGSWLEGQEEAQTYLGLPPEDPAHVVDELTMFRPGELGQWVHRKGLSRVQALERGHDLRRGAQPVCPGRERCPGVRLRMARYRRSDWRGAGRGARRDSARASARLLASSGMVNERERCKIRAPARWMLRVPGLVAPSCGPGGNHNPSPNNAMARMAVPILVRRRTSSTFRRTKPGARVNATASINKRSRAPTR
jgi:hypothetical protein